MDDLNGVTMAYLGDAIYEVYVRKHLIIDLGIRHVDKLHKTCIKYTNAKSQAKIIDYYLENNLLSEEELLMYKRGRNSSASQAHKTCSVIEYKKATGFEALICFVSENEQRLVELLNLGYKIVEN